MKLTERDGVIYCRDGVIYCGEIRVGALNGTGPYTSRLLPEFSSIGGRIYGPFDTKPEAIATAQSAFTDWCNRAGLVSRAESDKERKAANMFMAMHEHAEQELDEAVKELQFLRDSFVNHLRGAPVRDADEILLRVKNFIEKHNMEKGDG